MRTNLAYNTYQQNSIQVESPFKLVEMLYEGILRFTTRARRSIEKNDIEKRVYWINRASAIFTELIHTLDYDNSPEIAEYLNGLYAYQLQLLSEANAHNEVTKLATVNGVVKGLLEAWRESMQNELDQ